MLFPPARQLFDFFLFPRQPPFLPFSHFSPLWLYFFFYCSILYSVAAIPGSPPECQDSATFPKPLPPTCLVPSTFRSTKTFFWQFYCGPGALRAQLQQLAKSSPSSPPFLHVEFHPHLAAFLFPLHCVLLFHTILVLCSFSCYRQVRFSLFASLPPLPHLPHHIFLRWNFHSVWSTGNRD